MHPHEEAIRLQQAICCLDERTICALHEELAGLIAGENGASRENREIFWGAVHTARLFMPLATDEEKQESRSWLVAHKMEWREEAKRRAAGG